MLGPMGSSNSRQDSRPRRPNRSRTLRRTFFSIFICGASSLHPLSDEMEDDPAELLASSAEHIEQQKLQNPKVDVASAFNYSGTEIGVSSGGSVVNFDDSRSENYSSNVEGGNKRERLPENMEVVAPENSGCESSGSTVEDQSFSNSMTNIDNAETQSSAQNEHMPQNCGVTIQSSSASFNGIVEFSSSGDLIGNRASEFFIFNNYDSTSTSVVSSSPLTSYSSGYDLCQDIIPSSLEFLVSEREQSPRIGGMVHVGVVGISSNVHPNSSAEINSHGARHNNRRLFWDAFSRNNADSSSFVFVNDDSGDVWSQDRWRLGQRRLRSEICERLSGDPSASDHQTTSCPTGIHLRGPCSCDSMLVAQESGSPHISGMFMLAEALFEVLDEMDPLLYSISVVSLPAPESVVDSFQMKSYSKKEELTQCNICLAEYEKGDKIRVLPCHHEFHMECVDKWLKEIRGVCPLCRGDVCLPGSTSNSEVVHSL